MRGFFHPRLAAAALFGFLASGAPAEADELVNFVTAGHGDAIQGYLSRPKGPGPFPAVVLLHTCLGLPAERASIGERIAAWGYVALFVDDFATRGLKDTCAVEFRQALGDADGALAYLASLPYVDPARIAALGFPKEATPRSRSQRAARPVSRRLLLFTLHAPTWQAQRSTSRHSSSSARRTR